MKYQLENLEQLVSDAVSGQGDYVLSPEEIAGIVSEALQETEKIRASIIAQVFEFQKSKEVELFINNYQTALAAMLNRLYIQEQQLIEEEKISAGYFTSVYRPILRLLTFIEDRFASYFDRTEAVPAIYLAVTCEHMKMQASSIRDKLDSFIGEPELVQIILNELASFTSNAKEDIITYNDVIYHKELIRELGDINSWNKDAQLYAGIHHLLIYLNYNDKYYINYMAGRLDTVFKRFEDLNDKLDNLLVYLKTLHQIQKKPTIALRVKHPAAFTQIANWLTEEIYYTEKKLGLLQLKKQPADNAPLSGNNKLTVNSSVDQIGIFLRAASEIKLINSPSQKALFDQIVPWLSTRHTSNISAGSMRSKSYTPERKDLEQVKDILMQLYKVITKY